MCTTGLLMLSKRFTNQRSQCPGRPSAEGSTVAASPTAASSWDWIRNSAPVRFAPRRSASRKSTPMTSALRRSAPFRSAPIRYAPRRLAPRRSAPRSFAPIRSAPRWSRRRPPLASARASSLDRSSRTLTSALSAGTSVRRSVSGRSRDAARSRERQRLGEIAEQFVQVPHDREDLEHLPGRRRGLTPVPAAEGDLGDLLTRTEAVVDGAAPEPLVAQPGVDAAGEVLLTEVGTGPAGALVDREVHRGREGGGDTAEREAVRTVGTKAVRGRQRRGRAGGEGVVGLGHSAGLSGSGQSGHGGARAPRTLPSSRRSPVGANVGTCVGAAPGRPERPSRKGFVGLSDGPRIPPPDATSRAEAGGACAGPWRTRIVGARAYGTPRRTVTTPEARSARPDAAAVLPATNRTSL